MRTRTFALLAVMGLLVAGALAPAALADSHGEITGIQWQWAELVETEPAAQSVVPDPENYVLVLMEDFSAPIKADCNQVLWTYSINGTTNSLTLTFNTLGPSTLAYCGDDSLDTAFLAKMGLGGTVSVVDGRLVLELSDGSGTMTFDNGGAAEAAPETVPETGGAPLFVPWAATVLAGLALLTAGVALRRKK